MKNESFCELINTVSVNNEIFRLDFTWQGTAPKAGQFFMIKPKRSAVFLGRPISSAGWQPNMVTFLVLKRGKGTEEITAMRIGETAELTGPLGNSWSDFLPSAYRTESPIALVGGGIGIAPLSALLYDPPRGYNFDLYAGFRTDFKKYTLLGEAILGAKNVVIATEDGKSGHKGFITDVFEPGKYAAVFACGPEKMLKTIAEKCRTAGIPCAISMEKRMACGVGVCMGCTIKTVNGNRRCCAGGKADGPIFKADEVIFDE